MIQLSSPIASHFRYKEGNEVTSTLFISFIVVFLVMVIVSILNYMKSRYRSKSQSNGNTTHDYNQILRKYMVKSIERLFFCLGVLLMIFYLSETSGLLKNVEWLIDENLSSTKIDISSINKDSFIIYSLTSQNDDHIKNNNISIKDVTVSDIQSTLSPENFETIDKPIINSTLDNTTLVNLTSTTTITNSTIITNITSINTTTPIPINSTIEKNTTSSINNTTNVNSTLVYSSTKTSKPTTTTDVAENSKNIVELPLSMSKNKIISVTIQLVLVVLIFYLQIFIVMKYQRYLISSLSLQSQKRFTLINRKYIDILDNIKRLFKIDQKKLLAYLQDEFNCMLIDNLMEVPWIFGSVTLVISWISVRLYLENTQIHAIAGKWSIEHIFYPIHLLAWITLISSIVVLLYCNLYIRYNNVAPTQTISTTQNKSNNKDKDKDNSVIINNNNSTTQKLSKKKKKQQVENEREIVQKETPDDQSTSQKLVLKTTPHLNIHSFDSFGLITLLKVVMLVNSVVIITLYNLMSTYHAIGLFSLVYTVSPIVINIFILNPLIIIGFPFCSIISGDMNELMNIDVTKYD
ncbi:hypothetical protein DLAC_03750 [Tieghemostelium lacteum]|uniref:Uncharacterized protein n=1 Tax=Tieghemostelium lacteum TaxID=361077 RepID=A0A152A0M1_TIELA|nr:hypothetical protein DLAC_03750 [Tieghemostelium lacteum]|eukprot:KYQ99802.1 hypothetical protein DLAC_03750 [Tieghemostelium lacteum]